MLCYDSTAHLSKAAPSITCCSLLAPSETVARPGVQLKALLSGLSADPPGQYWPLGQATHHELSAASVPFIMKPGEQSAAEQQQGWQPFSEELPCVLQAVHTMCSRYTTPSPCASCRPLAMCSSQCPHRIMSWQHIHRQPHCIHRDVAASKHRAVVSVASSIHSVQHLHLALAL
jgi:hypothetical protein